MFGEPVRGPRQVAARGHVNVCRGVSSIFLLGAKQRLLQQAASAVRPVNGRDGRSNKAIAPQGPAKAGATSSAGGIANESKNEDWHPRNKSSQKNVSVITTDLFRPQLRPAWLVMEDSFRSSNPAIDRQRFCSACWSAVEQVSQRERRWRRTVRPQRRWVGAGRHAASYHKVLKLVKIALEGHSVPNL
jgi:hypothetical protein